MRRYERTRTNSSEFVQTDLQSGRFNDPGCFDDFRFSDDSGVQSCYIQANFDRKPIQKKRLIENMPSLPRLTEMAHSLVSLWLRPGDLAIDATAGNGHDTALMARLVGPTGSVLALDIQPEGLENTRLKLLEEGSFGDHIKLVLADHARLEQLATADWMNRVRVIMFNLGYRPNSERPVSTGLVTTLSAMGQSLGLLEEGGLMTVVAYRAHDGGESETQAILEWAMSLDDRLWHVARYDLPNIRSRPPILLAINKRKHRSLVNASKWLP